jgi:protocatechuate 3,4-dioxygenase beta subunit
VPDVPDAPDRREVLRTAGALGLSAAGLTALSGTSEAALVAGGCTLTATQAIGPFYRDLNLVRSDITEGLPGIALELVLRVLDVDGCTPLAGAEVEVWHTNADGKYSNFASEGTAGLTWMRGVQFANAQGVVRFRTIYPGWYSGRTTHVHAKIYPQTGWELNTQLYFHDPLSNQIYARPPYAARGPKNTTNAADVLHAPALEMRAKLAADPVSREVLVLAGLTIVVDRP